MPRRIGAKRPYNMRWILLSGLFAEPSPNARSRMLQIHAMRNRITAQLLKAFLNHKIKEFGKMTTLHIDTQEKHISLTANLLGETEPIDASLKYTLEESDGRTFFVPTELTCSRQWLSLLAQQMLKDNVIRFEIPSGIAATMVKVLKI